jgi:hypothetical protein
MKYSFSKTQTETDLLLGSLGLGIGVGLGNTLQDLQVEFNYAGKTYTSTPLADYSKYLGGNRYEVAVKIPETVVLTQSGISLKRKQQAITGTDPIQSKIIEFKSQRQAWLELPDTEYALVSRRNADRVDVIDLKIDPHDKPNNLQANARKWHQQIAAIKTDASNLEGIEATADPNKMIFTNRRNDNQGFGVLTVTKDDPTKFSADASKYVGLHLTNLSFELNDGRAAAITKDGKYAFVLGYNGYQKDRGFELIPDAPFGTSVGIIENPFEPNAKLIAATRSIPMGLGADLELSSDGKFLTATYPGVDGVFIFNVEEMRRTLEVIKTGNLAQEFKIDRRTK